MARSSSRRELTPARRSWRLRDRAGSKATSKTSGADLVTPAGRVSPVEMRRRRAGRRVLLDAPAKAPSLADVQHVHAFAQEDVDTRAAWRSRRGGDERLPAGRSLSIERLVRHPIVIHRRTRAGHTTS